MDGVDKAYLIFFWSLLIVCMSYIVYYFSYLT